PKTANIADRGTNARLTAPMFSGWIATEPVTDDGAMDATAAQAGRPGTSTRTLSVPVADREHLIEVLAVGSGAIATFLLVRQTGGLPNAFTNLGYLAIV